MAHKKLAECWYYHHTHIKPHDSQDYLTALSLALDSIKKALDVFEDVPQLANPSRQLREKIHTEEEHANELLKQYQSEYDTLEDP